MTRGEIAAVDPEGYLETKTHYAGMKFADPHPMVYPVVTVRGREGMLEVTLRAPVRE